MMQAPGIARQGRACLTTALVALCAAGVLVGGSAATATAADQTFSAELTSVVAGTTLTINSAEGDPVSAYGALLVVRLDDGSTVHAYCIQHYIPTTYGNTYRTVAWASTTTALGPVGVGPIRWILDHAPPAISVADFEALSGTTLTDAQAYAAVQAAIWHFSDATDLERDPLINPPAVIAAYDYLVAQATANAAYVAPDPSLTLDAPADAGRAGERVGPFTVHVSSTAAPVAATLAPGTPSGVTIVDSSGTPVTGPVSDGQQLFLSVPPNASSGSATIELNALVDRRDLMLMPDQPAGTQRLTLASTVPATITAAARGLWVARAPTAPIGDVAPRGDVAPVTGTVAVARHARLKLTKRASRRVVTAGGHVRFTLVVRNVGRATARNARVCDRLPDRVTVLGRSGGELAGGKVCWSVRAIGVGRAKTRSLTLRVDRDAPAGTITNRATAQLSGQRAVHAARTVKVRKAAVLGVRDGLVTG